MNRITNALLLALALVACIAPSPAPAPAGGLWPDCATGQGGINNMTIVLPEDALDPDLFDGALIGAFTPDGDCVGLTLYEGFGNTTLTVHGVSDPPGIDPRGAEPGEDIEIRVLNQVRPVVVASSTLVYANDGLITVASADFPVSGAAADQIANLQAQVSALETERDALVAERDDLASQLSAAQSANSALTTKIDDAVAILTN